MDYDWLPRRPHAQPGVGADARLVGGRGGVDRLHLHWLAGWRKDLPQRVPELPGDVSAIKLTRPVIFYAVIRALAIGIAVAIAFGLHLPNAQWMSLAALVTMKPNLAQSALRGGQRAFGTLLGAIVAALFLLLAGHLHVLEVVSFVALGVSVAFFPVSYTIYAAAMAASVLIAMGLPNPTNHAAEAQRVLLTFVGVAIGVVITLLANVLVKRTAKQPQAAR